MNQNEQQTIDLVVGPLASFDDAVAFGDALYGLDGVTRLALNEFDESRASFTFTVRSLESTRAALHQIADFPVAGVDQLDDGTLQVALGAAAQAPTVEAAPAQALASNEADSDSTYFAEPQPVQAPEPFVAPLTASPEAARDPFRTSQERVAVSLEEPVVAAPPTPQETAGWDSPLTADAAAQTFTPQADDWNALPTPTSDFSTPAPFNAQPERVVEETAQPAPPLEQYRAAAETPSDNGQAFQLEEPAQAFQAPSVVEAPAMANVESDAPWPSAGRNDLALDSVAAGQEMDNEVARLIIQVAAELRGAADSLAELAVRLSNGGQQPAWEQPTGQSWSAPPATSYHEDTETDDNVEAEPEYSAPAYKEPEPSWQPQAADQDWSAEQSWQPAPAAPSANIGAPEVQDDDEERGWEAPPMPSIGAISAIRSEGGAAATDDKASLANAQAVALATAMGRKPAQVSLMATGFASFADANRFIAALRQVPGVRNVAISELDQGRLRLSMDYFGSQPLDSYLHELQQAFPHHVVKASAHEIEIQLAAA